MGLQMNLGQMLNLPEKVKCPKCSQEVNHFFEDFDVEAGDPNPSKGRWELLMYCEQCDYNFYLIAEIEPKLSVKECE